MPQLDALTYFSQYVWLIITFGSVYYFVVQFIIPSTASALKLRAKLNSTRSTHNFDGEQDLPSVHLLESHIACHSWSSNMPLMNDLSLVTHGQWLQAWPLVNEMQCLLAKKKLIIKLLIPFRKIKS